MGTGRIQGPMSIICNVEIGMFSFINITYTPPPLKSLVEYLSSCITIMYYYVLSCTIVYYYCSGVRPGSTGVQTAARDAVRVQ